MPEHPDLPDGAVPENSAELAKPSASRLDVKAIAPALAAWLTDKAGSPVTVTGIHLPDGNGMSSETVIVDAQWGGAPHPLVARVAPDPNNDPLFASYDLDNQFRLMAYVGQRTTAPVPPLYWSEPGTDIIGAPFIVMGRVDGDIPPDVLPYTFGSWLTEADEQDRRRLQHQTVHTLAAIHAAPIPVDLLPAPARENPLSPRTSGGSPSSTGGRPATVPVRRCSNAPSRGCTRTSRPPRTRCSVGGMPASAT